MYTHIYIYAMNDIYIYVHRTCSMQQGSASCQLQAEMQLTWDREGGPAWNSAKRTLNEARESVNMYICICIYIRHVWLRCNLCNTALSGQGPKKPQRKPAQGYMEAQSNSLHVVCRAACCFMSCTL